MNKGIYELNGKVSIKEAIPFAFQHVLAMFLPNVVPIVLITQVAKINGAPMSEEMVALLIQNSMFVSGVASLMQVIGVWRVGSRLPMVMGVSFTFLTVLMMIAGRDNNYAMGAVIIGGLVEGTLGLTYKFWKGIVSPIVSACVVCSIGLSLFSVGTNYMGGGNTLASDYGSLKNLLVAVVSLVVCIVWKVKMKGMIQTVSILAGLIAGYIVSIPLGLIDFSNVLSTGIFSLPRPFVTGLPKFDIKLILPVVAIYLVSATETIGDSAALCVGGLNRDITIDETSKTLACDGYASTIAGIFSCTPITSFSQNVGLINMTKVVNRFVVIIASIIILLAGFFPPLAKLLSSIPNPVLGGCTILMFGHIFMAGIQMISKVKFTSRNVMIAAISLCIGYGFSSDEYIFNYMPAIVKQVFYGNIVAIVFVLAVLLNIFLPNDMDEE